MAPRTQKDVQNAFVKMEAKLAYIAKLNLEVYIKNLDTCMTTMEMAVATIGATMDENIEEKNKFWKEVLESKAISNIGKLSSPSEYRMWSKQF